MANEIEEEIREEQGLPIGTIAVALGLILVIGLAVYFFILRNRNRAPSPQEIARQITTPAPKSVTSFPEVTAPPASERVIPAPNVPPPAVAPDTGGRRAEQVFEVHVSDFSFSVPEIRVNRGDVVKILLVNDGGVHNLGIDEFNARTETIAGGQVTEIIFLADKAGTFEFYCSVNNHRALGMVGKLVVE